MAEDEGEPAGFTADVRAITQVSSAFVARLANTWHLDGGDTKSIVRWAQRALSDVQANDSLMHAIESAVTDMEQSGDPGRVAISMLRQEAAAVRDYGEGIASRLSAQQDREYMVDVRDTSGATQSAVADGSQPGHQVRDAAIKRFMSMVKILLGSIIAMLGDLLSPGFKAMLEGLKEAYEAFA